MLSYFYNSNLPIATNSILWWTWESIIHHMYFIVLFVQRQFSEKWETKQLWRVNMEKECEFFSLLFGGDAPFCAQATSSLFAGLWFRTDSPQKAHLDWIGRLIANYQHSEATIHFLIVGLGLIIVFYLGGIKKPTKVVGGNVPGWIRWSFFLSLCFEVYTMCVPYLFLFGWVWMPFVEDPKSPLVSYIEQLHKSDSFLIGIQFGAALITMFWVSVVVLILDLWAMVKAWEFARNGKSNMFLAISIMGGTSAFLFTFVYEFFSTTGRGSGEVSMTEVACDALHHMIGGDYTPMRTLMN